jgi:hypothetical protein
LNQLKVSFKVSFKGRGLNFRSRKALSWLICLFELLIAWREIPEKGNLSRVRRLTAETRGALLRVNQLGTLMRGAGTPRISWTNQARSLIDKQWPERRYFDPSGALSSA